MSMIEIDHLVKSYPIGGDIFVAVDDVSFSVESGEFLSIIGHSGSGKTTLLNLIGGLTKPLSGTVKIAGEDIWQLGDSRLSELRNEKLNFIFQFASLIPTLNVIDNVLLPATFGKGSVKELYTKAEGLLAEVGLSEKKQAYPAHLSGGQQRRVAIARAFINDPEVILADEPTGDLDPETELEIVELFRSFNKKMNTTFIIVTHSNELAALTDTQMRMDHGGLSKVS